MLLSEFTHVFYVPGSNHVIDCAWNPEGKGWQTAIKATPQAELLKKYPDAQLLTWDEVEPLLREADIKKYKKEPFEVTEERWYEMLEVLPPMKWRSGRGAESFMLSEGLAGNLRTIFCRIGDRYFELADESCLTHEQIADLCQPLL